MIKNKAFRFYIRFICSPPFIAILFGLIFPWAGNLSFLIPCFLMLILYFAFLDINYASVLKISAKPLKIIIFVSILSVILFFMLSYFFDKNMAVAVSLMGLAPTALASPSVAKKIGRDLNVIVMNIIYTNLSAAFLYPAFFIYIARVDGFSNYAAPFLKTVKMIFIPFVAALLVKKYVPPVLAISKKGSKYSIYIWGGILAIATSSAVFRIKNAGISPENLSVLFVLALGLIFFKAFAGYFMDKDNRIEFMQSLFHNNTMYAAWFSLSFLPPLASITPIFYALFQNMFLTFMISLYSVDNENKAGCN